MANKPKQFKPNRHKGTRKFTFNKTGRAKGYDSTWEKYRRRFLYHNPYCYCCPNKATVVDHIKAHKGDEELFKATNNHLPLCKHCHDTITGKFDRHKEQKLEEKIDWINEQREIYGNTRRVKVLPRYS